ncbi:hypothetical protein LTR78_007631 [Recurvomyces mirabilis]|uniref:SET domain-containing protein n=1 Tax=Recurvomyces mirabilis TaxID=574656 RepID=A0AAE0TRR3_9PEZI|nr:hypothetical protein LTR78_007631 [Recurvomyces mirabilis]KAK5159858.1 hypothetical protein LTS14_001963 [Recurvomyces mirabilis]
MPPAINYSVNSLQYAQTNTYRVACKHVSKVICHRLHNDEEQYLVGWKTPKDPLVPPGAICSWHGLAELSASLHHVQLYLESVSAGRRVDGNGQPTTPGLKRKSPDSSDSDTQSAPNFATSLRKDTPLPSRETSVISIGSSSSITTTSEVVSRTFEVYNGILQRKEGKILAKKSRDEGIVKRNAANLPDAPMLQAAAHATTAMAEQQIRIAFENKLGRLRNVRWENYVDNTAPSLDFTFIDSFTLRPGVYRSDPDAHEGCQYPCRQHMGQNIGCEYPRLCTCLEFAAVNEPELKRENEERYQQHLQQKQEKGYFVNTTDLPKRFPYQKPNKDNPHMPSKLQTFYLDQRYPIYECNLNCNCGSVCKSRVVQKGRKVPLVIFKTPNRGWGVKCDEELIRGEFIDTYIGEVITNAEADVRESKAGKDKSSYLYSLDKFVGDAEDLTPDTCYVVDGQFMGGPTRFINHSCEPNIRQYTVSYNKHDLRVYDLAFFAIEDVPAGTELTFDYMDKDEEEEEEVLRQRAEAAADPSNEDKLPCNCGAKKCRGYLWV